MTEQYAQPNINNPRQVRSFTAALPPASVQLTFDDGLVVVDTTVTTIAFTLPLASQFPGWQIILKATNAGTSGNAVLVAGQAGETIDGDAFVLLTTDQEALFLKSDGANWRVVGGGSGAVASSLSLDLTFDADAAASIPPVLFITWLEILAAISIIPGNPASTPPYVTPYRLNLAPLGFGDIGAGIYDLSNAHFRTVVKGAPDGGGLFIGASGFFTFENVASVNGVEVGGPSFGSTFLWSVYDFAEIHDSSFSQSFNGPPGPGILGFPISGSVLRATGSTFFRNGAIEAGLFGGDFLTIDAYDRCTIGSDALFGPGDVEINIFSGATTISFSQPFLGGTLDIDIGGVSSPGYTLGETIFFSSGGPIDFSAAIEAELYAGGTNPPGAPPQVPIFAVPLRGYSAPKDGYLRGIGVQIPTTRLPFLTFDINVYVAGVLVMTEPFDTAAPTQFSSFTFAQYDEGDRINVTITPTSTDFEASLADGIVVSLRSA